MRPEPFDPEKADLEARLKRLEFFVPTADAIADPPKPSIAFGIKPLDDALGGGLSVGEHLLIGFSHNGKSLLVENMVVNNPDRHVVIMSPDETVDMVVDKIIEMASGNSSMSTAERSAYLKEHFPRLVVQDRELSTDEIERFLDEAILINGPIDLIVYDYLDLLRGRQVGDDVRSKGEWLKKLAKFYEAPVLVLHQGSRTNAGKGQPLTMSSGAYGGEQAAFTVIGVYQRKFDPDLPRAELQHLEDHPEMMIQVLKNKQKRRGGLRLEGMPVKITHNGRLTELDITDVLSPSPKEIRGGFTPYKDNDDDDE